MSTPPAGACCPVCAVTLRVRTERAIPPLAAARLEEQPGRTPAFRTGDTVVSLASLC